MYPFGEPSVCLGYKRGSKQGRGAMTLPRTKRRVDPSTPPPKKLDHLVKEKGRPGKGSAQHGDGTAVVWGGGMFHCE